MPCLYKSIAIRTCFAIGMTFLLFSARAQNDSIGKSKIELEYTDKGFQFSTSDDRFQLHIESRLQFRFATPGDQNPLTFDDLDSDQPVFKINRARLKVGGHAFKPYLKYYWEYELSQGNLLDFRIMFERLPEFKIKVGQWKTYYNRERVISSGKQQLADRSIINRPFTVDRQMGISFYGRVFPGSLADFTYHASVLTGTGRGVVENDDSNFMYVGRLQWNFLGRELEMTGSDLFFHKEPTALIALGALTNRSPFTRFSQAGGGQLSGFDEGLPGQYRVNQGLLETAFMWRGFSWQNEFHTKEIIDKINGGTTRLTGSYYQAGYFFYNLWEVIPKPLELAVRYAQYIPNTDQKEDREEELTLGLNWFFKGGHRNKLTAEISVFDFETSAGDLQNTTRFRVQWDISF
ncbi:porin [Robiginitalea aurantiaca]|uniref:Porin n=1 Tax=Robiginitalea aurantiaca TaxID=3056915 RepID=A0ABT7WI53_9FLAO|nr:porin [Robiginitalea aurantiaca]MDM9632599.1 porin [Robiginitalea aurantiaca]